MTPRERCHRAIARTLRTSASVLADDTLNPDPVRHARMADAVRRLPRRQRDVLLAVRLDDLSHAEIAARAGLAVDEVKRLFAAAFANACRNLDHPPRCWWRRWLP